MISASCLRIFCVAAVLAFPFRARAADAPPAAPDTSAWRDPNKPIAARVQALMSPLTMKEKTSLINWLVPAIDRLGMPEYNHGNECLQPGTFDVLVGAASDDICQSTNLEVTDN